MTAIAAPHEDIAPAKESAVIFTPVIVGILLVYAATQVFLYWVHVPWRDEGQAWLWATSIDNFREYLIVPGEGHPPLWFWLLKLLSLVLSFDQARFFTVLLAIFNAILLIRLLRGDILVSVLILFSATIVYYWGYNFRPYTVVLFLMLAALTLDRQGKTESGTWLMAIACGFHFFAGFLFAFWLTVAWRRGLRFPQLILPASLALFFGALVVFSGQTNAELEVSGLESTMLAVRIFGNVFSANLYPPEYAALLSIGLMGWMFRRDAITLISLLGFAILFAAFAGLVYGRYDWHTAFILGFLIMGYCVTAKTPARWPLLILLAPGLIYGVFKTLKEPGDSKQAVDTAYSAVIEDAGPRLDTTRNLIVWPDFLLLGPAARDGFQYVSGNNGALVGPVDLSTRQHDDIDSALLARMDLPYWLVCIDCEDILPHIEALGGTAYELYETRPSRYEHIIVYRIGPDSILSGDLRPSRINANN